jgi:hypothetical protein
MAQRMSFDYGLEKTTACFKRKYRWLMKIPGVSDEPIGALPPNKSARPSLAFKSMEAQHLHETIFFPGKPDWKPVTLTLFDIKKNKHPVMEWIKLMYEVDQSSVKFKYATDGFKKEGKLELYDGCGEIIERWIFENMYIENADFGELDYSDSSVDYVDLTIRYDRAYWEQV